MQTVDDIFTTYARSFEATREAEMSLADYLAACRHDPMMYASATELLMAALGEPASKFVNRNIRVYPAFDEFYGMEETIERIVGFLRQTKQGKEVMCLLGPYLLGPFDRDDWSLAEWLRDQLEKHPIHVLKAGEQMSPVFESPLGLFQSERQHRILEDRYGIPRRRLSGRMSPWSAERLDEFDNDLSRFRVQRLYPWQLQTIGIVEAQTGRTRKFLRRLDPFGVAAVFLAFGVAVGMANHRIEPGADLLGGGCAILAGTRIELAGEQVKPHQGAGGSLTSSQSNGSGPAPLPQGR